MKLGLPKQDQCTGCSACAAVCPRDALTMTLDASGFYHPVLNRERCVSCGKCGQVCPVHGPAARTENDFFAALVRDGEALARSTSGGVFGALAQLVLHRGGAVYGAAYDEGFRVHHIRVTDREGLGSLRGAKYAQSDLSDTFRQVRSDLKAGRWVLFSGTPCQAAGLRGFLGREEPKLVTVDLVCHSVPSPLAWERYVEFRAGEEGKPLPVAVNQRSKKTGWLNYAYSSQFCYGDGTESLIPAGEDVFLKAFLGGLITNPACESCPAKGPSRYSDFTLGDFWGVEHLGLDLPLEGGVSAVMVHTEKGRSLWAALEPQLQAAPVIYDQMRRQNPAMEACARGNPNRETFLQLLDFGQAEAFLPRPKPARRNPLGALLGRVRETGRTIFRK